MARDFQINGEAMVSVKGPAGSTIATIQQLGLSDGPIQVSHEFHHRDITLDAWGGEVPADVQVMLAAANVTMNLIHVDRDILDVCIRLAMGNPAALGNVARAGTRMGANTARFNASNKFVGLNIASPGGSKPYRFYFAYLVGNLNIPLGVEKSVFALTWRCVPYTQDPWNAGVGAADSQLYDHTLDT